MEEYSKRLIELMDDLDYDSIEEVVNLLLGARKDRKTIFICGNGGSATTALHFANDLNSISSLMFKYFKVIALTGNISAITSIANDCNYDDIFTYQLDNLAEIGDILIGISASGDSNNVFEAIRIARQKEMITVSFTGFNKSNDIKRMSSYNIHANAEERECGLSEDIHMILCHMITDHIREVDKKEKNKCQVEN